MWPVVIGCAIGALLMARTKPTSSVSRRQIIGPTTGNVYSADDFTDAGVVIVHGPECACVFARKPTGGFGIVSAKGNPEGIRMIVSDLQPQLLPSKKET
jgi:hypothetical protein